MSDKPADILSMSDEEFSKLPGPPEIKSEEPEKPVEETPAADPAQDNTQDVSKDPEPEPKPEEPAKDEEPAESKPQDETPEAEPEEPKPEDAPAPPAAPEPAPKLETPAKPEPEKKPESAAPEGDKPKPEAKLEDKPGSNFESFFKQVMAPFKANGKMIQLQSADEVIALMQMGANYTRKMQAIQGSKKYLMMLENNGLLDENKLSFLIDLDKKNPEAIKKLLQDSKINPSDLDISGEPSYKNGSHAVSDQEVALNSAIDELNSSPEGKATLQSVNSWDPASKKVLWDSPDLLAVIHTQHENGIYTKIVAEMERRKLLGHVDPSTPFLKAYKLVGDDMMAKGAFGVAKPAAAPPQPTAGTPVAVRPAKTPAAKAAEAAKVRAAASPRSAVRTAKPDVNYLAMSDEEFEKIADKI